MIQAMRMRLGPLSALAIALLALAAGGAGIVIVFGSRLTDADVGGTGLMVVAAALLAAYLIRRPWVRVGMAAVANWIPVMAASATLISLFLLPVNVSGVRPVATAVGLIAGAVVWLAAAMVTGERTTVRDANSRAFAGLMERLRGLQAQLDCTEPDDPAACQARPHVAYLSSVLGGNERDSRWATGAGYQDLWTAVHRADEALIGGLNAAGLRRELLRDRLRLSGSKVDKALIDELDEIRRRLPKNNSGTQATAVEEFAGKVQAVRRAINEYRDARWDGLVNVRAVLSRSTLITAWAAYALALLAITLSAPREALAAAAVYFGVGALVGLLAQTAADRKRTEAVEDYGLGRARLIQLILASGVTAVAGVIFMAIGADVGGGGTNDGRDLGGIFDVGGNLGQLLVAAVFGLSPSLLLNRISSIADTYQEELSAMQAGEPAGGQGDQGSGTA
jgi:hypothetical protein